MKLAQAATLAFSGLATAQQSVPSLTEALASQNASLSVLTGIYDTVNVKLLGVFTNTFARSSSDPTRHCFLPQPGEKYHYTRPEQRCLERFLATN
jgi:hypothetical protein